MRSSYRRALRRNALAVALSFCVMSGAVHAQSNTAGSVFGQAQPGATVVIENTQTGLTRQITVGADGAFRASSLPTGQYKITLTRADGSIEVRENITVNVGTGASVSFAADARQLETIEVTSGTISPIDISSVESSTILSEAVIDRIPVPRTITDVALLAPGTTQGDSAFGNLASFGGSTVGENAYYINGFNVTNFRNGLGGSTVPFEFYQEFQVKTGGYGAEFGRSTGGVINAITKRGTNEWHYGLNAYWEPGSLAESLPCVVDRDGVRITDGCDDEFDDSIEANAYVSGPIVRDRLFMMLMYNARDVSRSEIQGGRNTSVVNDDPFWGAKLDWYITDNHLLEYTGFSDERELNEAQAVGSSTSFRGGRNDIFKYTGYLTDSFTLSALYGEGAYDRTDAGDGDNCPAIIDRRSGSRQDLGCWTNILPGTAQDSREASRIDAEWDLGDAFFGSHLLRFGVDRELTTSKDLVRYSGGVYYLYQATSSGDRARQRFYNNGGSFETESTAIYLEDNWQVRDDLLLSIGLRNEAFDNRNANGATFIEIKDQLAPRLGLSWDVKGDGSQKFFANYGRYFLPIASNTNIRLAGAELFTEQFFRLNGVNPDGTPRLGEALGPVQVFADGSIKDPRSIVNHDIEPMYQDEFIVGFQREFAHNWSGGVRIAHRDLKSTLEDVAIDAALNAYAAANGFNDFEAGGFDYYVLTNPGRDMRISVDLNGDGRLEDVFLSAAQLGYPQSERRYNAVELFFERSWDGVWFLQGSYTWSQSYGNNEGFVRSDNGQDDAGLTTLFDQPGLLDGAYGFLPNDRRHQIKLFGAWQFAPGFTASANLSYRTGRPLNCFGNHPTDEFAEAYGSESFYCGGQLVPRGSLGRTPQVTQVDLGLQWRPEFLQDRFAIKLDVVNAFNEARATELSEVGEFGHDPASFPIPSFGLPAAYQQPRYVRVGLSYDF
jgi:hypothetical protein